MIERLCETNGVVAQCQLGYRINVFVPCSFCSPKKGAARNSTVPWCWEMLALALLQPANCDPINNCTERVCPLSPICL